MSGILGTDVTLSEVESLLCRSLGTESRFGPNAATKRIGEGNGMLSMVAWLTADWQPVDERLPAEFVVKLPTIKVFEAHLSRVAMEKGEDVSEDSLQAIESMRPMILKEHNAECDMYTALETCPGRDRLKLVKCHVARPFTDDGPGFLVLEAVQRPHVQNLTQHTSIAHLEQVLLAYASIHARVLQLQSSISVPSTGLSETYGKVFDAQSLRAGILQMHARRDDKDEAFHCLIDRAAAIVPAVADLERHDRLPDTLGIPRVIVHADLFPGNVLWTRTGDAEGDFTIRAIIDWQMFHWGVIGEDLGRMFCTFLSPTDRRDNWQRLCRIFYDKVAEELGDTPVPYTYEQLVLSYRHCLPTCILLITAFLDGYEKDQIRVHKKSVSEAAATRVIMDEKIIGNLEDMCQGWEAIHKETSH